jgi:hypothetical protein
VTAPAKSRRLTGPRCSGELWGGWPGKAVHGSGASGVDERGWGETGTGRQLVFVLKKNRLGGTSQDREKGRGSAWARPRGGERRRKGGPWRAGRQRGAAINGPRPAGVGGAIATRTDEGDGRGQHDDVGERG